MNKQIQSCPDSHGKQILHITEIQENDIKYFHLCLVCGLEKFPDAFKDAEGVAKKQINLAKKIILNAKKIVNKTCPKCNHTLSDIKKEAKLGCPMCYEIFSEPLEQILKNCHDGESSHKGKQPKNAKSEKLSIEDLPPDPIEIIEDLKSQISNYEKKMKNAIEVENYEVAGILKNKIQELKDKLAAL